MSRTAITLKFKILWLPNEALYGAVKLQTDINIPSLIPHEDKNFGGSLVLDFRKRWRHLKTIYNKKERVCKRLLCSYMNGGSVYNRECAGFSVKSGWYRYTPTNEATHFIQKSILFIHLSSVILAKWLVILLMSTPQKMNLYALSKDREEWAYRMTFTLSLKIEERHTKWTCKCITGLPCFPVVFFVVSRCL